MTWGHKAASAVALVLIALTACSSAGEATVDNQHQSGGSGQTSAEAGSGDGDGDQTSTDEGDLVLDLGGQNSAPCDPWAQDCPSGEKCSWEQVAGVMQTRCVPIEPAAKPPGESCSVFGDPNSGYDDCELGALCAYLDASNQGVCMALCGGSPAEPTCAQDNALCHVCPGCPSLCVHRCDPLTQDCGAGFGCTPDSGDFACHPSDQLGGGELGDTCESAIQCKSGYACLEAAKIPGCAGAGCCSPFCSTSAPICPDALTCVPWFDTNNPPLPDLGVCQAL